MGSGRHRCRKITFSFTSNKTSATYNLQDDPLPQPLQYTLCNMYSATMAKVSKNITLPYQLAVRLEKEDNQSETVEDALKEWFDDF